MFGTIENKWVGIRVLYNLTRLKLPGTTWLALNGGVPDNSGVLFRVPSPEAIKSIAEMKDARN